MSDRPEQPARTPSSEDPLFYVALGRAIQVLRTERGLGRRELAELAGLSYPYLSEIETGKKRPSSATMVAIAEALGMQLSEVLGTAETLGARMAEGPLEATSRTLGAGKPLLSRRRGPAAAAWTRQTEEAAGSPAVAGRAAGPTVPESPPAEQAAAAAPTLGARTEPSVMLSEVSPRRRSRWFAAKGQGEPDTIERPESRPDLETTDTPSDRPMLEDLLEAASRLSDEDLRTLLELARRLAR